MKPYKPWKPSLKTKIKVRSRDFFKRWKKKLSIRPSIGVSYIYLDHVPASIEMVNGVEEEFEAEMTIIPLVVDDFVHHESFECGFEDDATEIFKSMESGYYRVEYKHHNDQEHCDGWPVGPEYVVFDYFANAEPSLLARWFEFDKYKLRPFVDHTIGLFMPQWSVDFEYGGAGMTKSRMFLPKAIWVRFCRPKRYARDLWGEGYTRLELYRR